MNDNFNHEKETLLSLSHEINLLRQQVNYLLRNEKALGLLDLDVLMNRTHTIYDMLCTINVGQDDDEQDYDIDPEALVGLFGAVTEDDAKDEPDESESIDVQKDAEESIEEEPETAMPLEETPTEEPEPEKTEEDSPANTVVWTDVPVSAFSLQETKEETEQEEPQEVATSETEALHDDNDIPTEEETITEEKPVGDDFGFFFRFEEEETEPAHDEPTQDEPIRDEPVVVDDKLVHFIEEIPEEQIPEHELAEGVLPYDNPMEMPVVEDELHDEPVADEPQKEEAPAFGGTGKFFDYDDSNFEMSAPETLGESLIHEDRSLAARFQQNTVRDLKSVIGINDKFLFVNELFGGSMEKYNKSIENLNDLKTLNGAMIYLNELKIELQWNSNNEAYRKLTDLVRRKFE